MTFFLTSILALFVTSGFYGILSSVNTTNPEKTLWDIITFSFLVGTLILTMTNKVLKKEQKEYFPRIGSSMLLSAILLLIGDGVKTFFELFKLRFVSYLGNIIVWVGLVLLSFTFASLFIELGKTVIDFRKEK
jgi:hypothetical protein